MVLRPDQFTVQAQQVLQNSQELVRRYNHSQWDVEHLLMALLEQEEGVPAEILRQAGVSVPAMRSRLDEMLERGPKVAHETSQIFVAPRAAKALAAQHNIATTLDNFMHPARLRRGAAPPPASAAPLSVRKLGARATAGRNRAAQKARPSHR